MKLGIPKGLLYYKYYPFIQTFFYELGVDMIESPETNREILDLGTKYCVDEACLPIKIFHGHAAYLKDKCDVMLIPRIMSVKDKEFICPKFCGLPEMIKNSIPDLPDITYTQIYANTEKNLYLSMKSIAHKFTKKSSRINKAFKTAEEAQSSYLGGIQSNKTEKRIALVGHPYNLYDTFVNMNIAKKLDKLGIGIITEEYVEEYLIDNEMNKLFKKPFWTFARISYGFSTYLAKTHKIDGIIYLSSFACGIDSIVIELIREEIGEFPLLVLKLDEHTGEAGFDTRLEAFSDMLERRLSYENKLSSSW